MRRPTWPPDGRTIGFLSIVAPLSSRVVRVDLDGGASAVPTPGAEEHHSVFLLADGRIGWATVERGSDRCRVRACEGTRSRIEVLDPTGDVAPLLEIDGVVDHVAAPEPRRALLSLQAFVAVGIPASAVLRMATLGAAEAVGASEHLGTLEVGKLADIVLLDANPLEDIRSTLSIWRVVKGGRVFCPVALQREPH